MPRILFPKNCPVYSASKLGAVLVPAPHRQEKKNALPPKRNFTVLFKNKTVKIICVLNLTIAPWFWTRVIFISPVSPLSLNILRVPNISILSVWRPNGLTYPAHWSMMPKFTIHKVAVSQHPQDHQFLFSQHGRETDDVLYLKDKILNARALGVRLSSCVLWRTSGEDGDFRFDVNHVIKRSCWTWG